MAGADTTVGAVTIDLIGGHLIMDGVTHTGVIVITEARITDTVLITDTALFMDTIHTTDIVTPLTTDLIILEVTPIQIIEGDTTQGQVLQLTNIQEPLRAPLMDPTEPLEVIQEHQIARVITKTELQLEEADIPTLHVLEQMEGTVELQGIPLETVLEPQTILFILEGVVVATILVEIQPIQEPGLQTEVRTPTLGHRAQEAVEVLTRDPQVVLHEVAAHDPQVLEVVVEDNF